ncbi:hypothetical protein PIB30_046263 [Stylosanthes scabra]|uniref:Uncharacterized protein n=1 Tax=Stylosanthes scabra TaxID=79078 RepID=A0ABU6XE44_9FABA|nr:hypothetical protein [Stylosanthes scabra]
MDFNPWGAFTLPLLFTWDELCIHGEGGDAEFRIIEEHCGVRPSLKTAFPYTWILFQEVAGISFQGMHMKSYNNKPCLLMQFHNRKEYDRRGATMAKQGNNGGDSR